MKESKALKLLSNYKISILGIKLTVMNKIGNFASVISRFWFEIGTLFGSRGIVPRGVLGIIPWNQNKVPISNQDLEITHAQSPT